MDKKNKKDIDNTDISNATDVKDVSDFFSELLGKSKDELEALQESFRASINLQNQNHYEILDRYGFDFSLIPPASQKTLDALQKSIRDNSRKVQAITDSSDALGEGRTKIEFFALGNKYLQDKNDMADRSKDLIVGERILENGDRCRLVYQFTSPASG